MRDLNYLNLKDLKSVAKYYQIEHKSRIKRVELEALICLAELSLGLGVIEGYNASLELMEVDKEEGISVMDVKAVSHSVLGGVLPSEHSSP